MIQVLSRLRAMSVHLLVVLHHFEQSLCSLITVLEYHSLCVLDDFYDAPGSSPRLASMWLLDRFVAEKREHDGNFEASFLHRTERYSINAFDCKPFTAIHNRAR
jgi:hypothetical protein